jgi:hypothetical protein
MWEPRTYKPSAFSAYFLAGAVWLFEPGFRFVSNLVSRLVLQLDPGTRLPGDVARNNDTIRVRTVRTGFYQN